MRPADFAAAEHNLARQRWIDALESHWRPRDNASNVADVARVYLALAEDADAAGNDALAGSLRAEAAELIAHPPEITAPDMIERNRAERADRRRAIRAVRRVVAPERAWRARAAEMACVELARIMLGVRHEVGRAEADAARQRLGVASPPLSPRISPTPRDRRARTSPAAA